MIGKIIAGSSFAATVGYVMNRCRPEEGEGHQAESIVGEAGMDKTERGKVQSRILGFEGIEPPGGCCGAIAPEQMQRRIGESHEEHIARVTALIRQATEAMKRINAEMKTALSDEKIKQAVQLFVSREAEKYKEMLDGHWTRIDNTLDHLLQRIPYNYDINKRLVKACI